MDAHDASAILWDAEWARAWKAHPANVWFAYEAEVYLDQLGPRDPAARALKTDAFDEACGRGQLSAGLGDDVVLVDVAPKILAHATRTRADAVPCVADVRCLPFRTGAFDLILSTSTLDHFEAGAEIDAALAELRRILGERGRLLLTLDNPRNPVLRVRHLVHAVTGKVAGLIPFRMGHTLSRRALVDALERAGFAVSESGYLVHAPRLVALWAGEWAARRHDAASARRLGRLFRAVERHARRAPTRRWTGHFVFADCRPALASHGGAPRRAQARWLVRWKVAEHRLRCAYLRHTPAAVLNRVDPVLRRAAARARRLAAVPVYLRHELATVTGACDGGTGRVAFWAAHGDRGVLLDALLDERVSTVGGGAHALGASAMDGSELARNAFGVLFLVLLLRPRGLLGDLRRMKRSAYRVEVWEHSPARSRLFYHRYLAPHVAARFGAHGELGNFAFIDRLFAAGAAVAVVRPGVREPDAIGLVVSRADTLWCVVLGTRDADPAILRAGGLAAVYRAQIALAHERGARLVDFGRCLPWATDGVVQYKLKWGIRPIPDGTQTLEYAVKVLRPESAAARRLVSRGVFVREGASYRPYTADDLSAR